MDDEAQKLSDMEYHKQRLARERDLARKIGAVEFMAQNVEPIFEAAFQHFESRGAWPDPVEYGSARSSCLPWSRASRSSSRARCCSRRRFWMMSFGLR